MKDPEHDQREDLLDWLGGEPFDPEAFDLKEVAPRVRRIR